VLHSESIENIYCVEARHDRKQVLNRVREKMQCLFLND